MIKKEFDKGFRGWEAVPFGRGFPQFLHLFLTLPLDGGVFWAGLFLASLPGALLHGRVNRKETGDRPLPHPLNTKRIQSEKPAGETKPLAALLDFEDLENLPDRDKTRRLIGRLGHFFNTDPAKTGVVNYYARHAKVGPAYAYWIPQVCMHWVEMTRELLIGLWNSILTPEYSKVNRFMLFSPSPPGISACLVGAVGVDPIQ